MRCPKCNTEISVKTNYCPECGEKLLKEPIDAAGVSEIDTTSQDRLLSLSRKSKIAIIRITIKKQLGKQKYRTAFLLAIFLN